jgi:hypothetical protein
MLLGQNSLLAYSLVILSMYWDFFGEDFGILELDAVYLSAGLM